MDIKRSGSVPSRRPPVDWFTGSVWQDPIIEAPAPARLRAVMVHFDPGARTNWHTHPLGQTLLIMSGIGLVQTEGSPVREVRAGDTVWFGPNERHWHGAAPANGMSHLAMQEALDGKSVDWLEKVSDDDYSRSPQGE
jgi:quercetin dioxygenase-like cupin family protein